jgi:hypothetical protein
MIEISFDQLSSTTVPDINKYEFETIQDHCKDIDGKLTSLLLFSSSDSIDAIQSKINKKNNNSVMAPMPCIIFCCTGFGIVMSPSFFLPFLLFVKYFRGFIVLCNSQQKNSDWKDLSTVIDYIVDMGFSSHSMIGLYGGSTSGVSIGNILARRPCSIAAAVVNNGLFDLSKYHQLNFPILLNNNYDLRIEPHKIYSSITSSIFKNPKSGKYWKNSIWNMEFGCAEESKEDCTRILALSPLNNINFSENWDTSISLPSVLFNTGKI